MILTGILIGIIVLTLLVAAHELGHALVAKKYGTVVEEFGIGFPPKAWSKKVKKSFLGENVEFSINWLPLGGFVRMQGEHDDAAKKGAAANAKIEYARKYRHCHRGALGGGDENDV